MSKRNNEHYVNNKDFLDALVVYRKECKEADLDGRERPIIPRYIAECFLKIANHLSYKPNFVNYMFREDMISDGVENCVQYVDRFNPEKSTNAFAYFTQIIWYAFIRRIEKEKKQLKIKGKILNKLEYDSVFSGDNNILSDDFSDYSSIKENIVSRMSR